MKALAQKALVDLRGRAVRTGRVPRRAGRHYFIESEGLHSRIHLQNFYSTFWPGVDAAATAHIEVFAASGDLLGRIDQPLPRFGSLFLELRDLLGRIGAQAGEGSVQIDLEPPEEVRAQLRDLPNATEVELGSPFWMAYYDAHENYMYVHAIEKSAWPLYGAPKTVAWTIRRGRGVGGKFRSWRLIDLEGLTEVQIVMLNHGPDEGTAKLGVYSGDDSITLFETERAFGPRQLHRVRIPAEEIRAWSLRHPELEHIRLGAEPLLTANGKPYVLLRHGDGPLSLHHA